MLGVGIPINARLSWPFLLDWGLWYLVLAVDPDERDGPDGGHVFALGGISAGGFVFLPSLLLPGWGWLGHLAVALLLAPILGTFLALAESMSVRRAAILTSCFLLVHCLVRTIIFWMFSI